MNDAVVAFLALAVSGMGVVLWFFVRKIMSMPETYATKPELMKLEADLHRDLQQHKQDQERNHTENRGKLDQIVTSLAAMTARIDNFLLVLMEKFK